MTALLQDRIPPQNLEMEQAVLGACLIERAAIETAAEILNESDFHRLAHGVIFQAILDLVNDDEPIDLLTVQDRLRNRGLLENIGGAPYLVQLTDACPTAVNVEHYAKIVADAADRRRLLSACNEIMQRCHDDHDEEIVGTAESIIYECSHARGFAGPMLEMRPTVARWFEWIEERSDAKRPVFGIPSGITKLDRMTNGLKPANLVIVGARPGMGKTGLLMNLAVEAAKHGAVAVFSLEMTMDELMSRMVAGMARVDSRVMESGQLLDHDWRKIGEACANISELPIHVCESTEITPAVMRGKLRRVGARQKLALVVVDYLQLVTPSRRSENRTQEVGEISRALKTIAREFNVPVIAAAQINRDATKRTDKRPLMSDLRESGSIEAEADLVLLIHRPKYYKLEGENQQCTGQETAELIVAKHRKGPTGLINVAFTPEFTRFDNLYEEDYA